MQQGIKGFNEDIKLTVEVKGIFALPDEWNNKVVSFQIFVTVYFLG